MSRCEEIIYSNDYKASYIFPSGEDLDTLKKKYNTECIIYISSNLSIAYVPAPVIGIESYPKEIFAAPYALLDTTSMEATGVLRLRRLPFFNLMGKDVIVGFVDTGIDYTHPVFKNADNTTRIIGIWDQTIRGGKPPEGLLYGTEYTREQINQALQSEDPLGMVPTRDELGHGTFMAGIAAGNVDEANDFTGAAPLADIVAVKLKPMNQFERDYHLVPKDAVCFGETDIISGIKYMYDMSVKFGKPLVICLGAGFNSGEHDENILPTRFLGSIGLIPGIAVIIAAGNEGNAAHHYYNGNVAGKQFVDVEINVSENEEGFVARLRASSPNSFSVGFMSPGGEYIEKIPMRLGESEVIEFLFEDTVIWVSYLLIERITGDELVLIRFIRPVSGIWKLRVYNEEKIKGEFHIWLPVDGLVSKNTYFIKPDPYTTITDPGNMFSSITATAYNHSDGSLYINSGRGYTRAGAIKPDIAAPGVNVYGPVPGGGFSTMTGTSVAAAHTAGAVALLMEWGIVKGNDLDMNSSAVKKYLIGGAKRTDMTYPNREWGYGILDISQTFERLRRTVG